MMKGDVNISPFLFKNLVNSYTRNDYNILVLDENGLRNEIQVSYLIIGGM
jgi:hypothetical protein